ncbi:MAG: tetratricopeptide repeat protein [Actinomycetota bacterium]|nr:tetratricopeptide repeat protein [Actinomycetota bacterium]
MLGLHQHAATSVREALKIYEGVGATAGPAAGATLLNLGCILAEWAEEDGVPAAQRAQLLAPAAGWLRAALTGAERGYGEDYRITGGLLRAMGAVLEAQGANEEARRHLERGEACRRRNLRADGTQAAIAISGAVRSLMAWGLYDEAQAYLERALEIREHALGQQNFDTSAVLFKLGILHQLGGRDEQARQHLQRALRVRAEICGETNPATELVRENLRLLDV